MVVRRVVSKLRRRLWQPALLFNRNVFAVDVDNRHIGMFAHLNVAIRILRYADEHGLAPLIRFTSANYVDPNFGPDWFDYHFERTTAAGGRTPRPLFKLTIETHRDLNLSRPDDLSLREARDLLFKYVQIRQDVVDEVDAFCARNALGPGSLGVHYRGTDKSTEAPRVAYEDVIAAIERELASGGQRKIFVASDEQPFIEALTQHFPPGLVCSFDDSSRSTGDKPLHLNQNSAGNFAMGRDALVNCLILSRCSHVIRTCSLLSSWASIFNPDLSVTLLNEAFSDTSWFPERVIAAELAARQARADQGAPLEKVSTSPANRERPNRSIDENPHRPMGRDA